MRRGKAVKALTPKARPFHDRQVKGLQDCANREGRKRGSLLHRVPVPLPMVRTPLLRSLDADRWGPRSTQNGHSQLQRRPREHNWEPPPPTRRPDSPRPRHAHGVPCPRHATQVRPTPDAWVCPAPGVLLVCHSPDQHALSVHPAPTPNSRRGPQASLLPPGETQGQANPPHRDNPSFLSADL